VGREENRLKHIKHISTTARISSEYDHDEVGYNYRMTNLQAAVGCAQLDRLDEFLQTKSRIRQMYNEALIDIPGVSIFPNPPDRTSTFWFSGFLVDDHLPSPREICRRLNELDIEARVFWKPVHLQAPYADVPISDLSFTEQTYGRIVTLPCSTNLSRDGQSRVIDSVRKVLGGL